jgi:Secretion system C-terminal sorting domain
LADVTVECLGIAASGDIFAGTEKGVYRSTDNGNTWTQTNGGLMTAKVNSLAINSDGFVFAGSDGRGVFRSLEPTTAITETRINQPLSFGLNQNYPNPFNPSTTIEFALPKASFVTLKIYDLLGNGVAILVAEKLPAGKHQRVWEAKGLASGVYLYRLQASDPSANFPSKSGQAGRGFVQTRKLILLR